MDCSSNQAPLFEGRLTSVAVDVLSFNQVIACTQDVYRTSANIARSEQHPFYLIAQRDSAWHVRQQGHLARPGDEVLVDSAQRYELYFPESVAVMSVQLPRHWVGRWLTQVDSTGPRVVVRERGWGAGLVGPVPPIRTRAFAGGELSPRAAVRPARRNVGGCTGTCATTLREDAWTLVGGEKCPMHRGDLILTPTGLSHEHGHDGEDPVIWLDVLDLLLIYYTETSYHLEGPSQSATSNQSFKAYARGGVAPTKVFQRSDKAYPMLRYPWADAKAELLSLAEEKSGSDAVQVTYVNPETGADAKNILGFYALMLRRGETLRLPARSPAQVFHQIEGQIDVHVEATGFTMVEADTCCAPGYTAVTLKNRSTTAPAFLFVADEAPLYRKLGVYENRG